MMHLRLIEPDIPPFLQDSQRSTILDAAGLLPPEIANLKVYICVVYSDTESVIAITTAVIAPARQPGGVPS
jgi:hypothetical protein